MRERAGAQPEAAAGGGAETSRGCGCRTGQAARQQCGPRGLPVPPGGPAGGQEGLLGGACCTVLPYNSFHMPLNLYMCTGCLRYLVLPWSPCLKHLPPSHT